MFSSHRKERRVRSWLNELYNLYDFSFGFNRLFQINFNGIPLEIEDNNCSGKIIISSSLTLKTGNDWFQKITQIHPNMHFEYSQVREKIFLTCSQSFETDNIKNKNQFRDILYEFKQEMLKTEEPIRSISKSYDFWVTDLHKQFDIEKESLRNKPDYTVVYSHQTLFPNRSRNGNGIIRSY